MKKVNNTIPNIWSAQEKMISFYRWLSAGLGIFASLCLLFGFFGYFKNPIVVLKAKEVQEFYPGQEKSVKIGKQDVEVFTKVFLKALYVWPRFDETALSKELSPYTEDGLTKKVISTQGLKYGKELKGKKIAQSLTFLKVDVLEDRVVAKFFRILLIENLPLVIPTEVTLSMIQGSPTRLNPYGIYVAGIVEHEGEH